MSVAAIAEVPPRAAPGRQLARLVRPWRRTPSSIRSALTWAGQFLSIMPSSKATRKGRRTVFRKLVAVLLLRPSRMSATRQRRKCSAVRSESSMSAPWSVIIQSRK